MIKKYFFFILIFMLLFSQIGRADNLTEKDPIFAGVLSWYMPGLGQFYVGKYLKGSIYWVVENTLFISAILTVADINFSANSEIGFELNLKPKDNLSRTQKSIGYSLAIGFVAFHIFNVIDAIQTTRNYNKIIEENENKNQSGLFLNYYNVANNNYLALNCKF